jgi:lipoprotein-anchoring transpeptidase ErfK/SrfK
MFQLISQLRRSFVLAAAATAISSAAANPMALFPFALPQLPQAQSAPEFDEPAVQTPSRFKRQVVNFSTSEAPGTIIVDTPNTFLYLVLGNGKALCYGTGVGREGFTWAGTKTIDRKAEWPDWTPPTEMLERQPYLPRFMAGGPGNPMGARAMYLSGSVYRIHGTNQPETIGSRVSSGCIRMTNDDVTDLYERVKVGAKVIVLPVNERRAAAQSGRSSSLH